MMKRMMTAALLVASLGAAACKAEVEDAGKLPDVDVSGGEAPKIDIDPANVNVSTDTQTVVTPEVTTSPAGGGDEK